MKRLPVLLPELTVLAFAFAQMASADPTNRYVVKDNPTALSPFTNWVDAAANIQAAINVCFTGDVVWVTNGVYDAGGVTNFPTGTILTNRIAIYKAITVRSANNDPTNTIIKGAGPIGLAAVRCVYMTNGSALIGFTLTNGATMTPATEDRNGGGVWSQSTNTVISNCVLTGNQANFLGGGAYRGTLNNCTLSSNSAYAGGGVSGSTLNNCTLSRNSAVPGSDSYGGGGAYYGTLNNCTLTNNSTSNAGQGGGTHSANLYNCKLSGNSVPGNAGGGASYGTLYNCTVSGNSAGSYGGGVRGSTLINCIVYFNSASSGGSNWYAVVAFTNTCTASAATNGVGNITSDPMFVDRSAGNYRLREGSPAINAGENFSWMTDPADVRSQDLDGQHRIDGYSRQVDMGAYEYFFRGTIFTIH